MNNTNYSKKSDLPKFIIVQAHDGIGNPRNVKYINEEALNIFKNKVESALRDLDQYALINKEREE